MATKGNPIIGQDYSTIFGIKSVVILAGFIGAVASLSYVRNFSVETAGLAVLSGIGCAAFMTPIVVDWFSLSLSTEYGVAFCLGVMGMNIIGGIYKVGEWFKKEPLKFLSRKNNGSDSDNR